MTAVLNVASAELKQGGPDYAEASRLLNRAVVAIHDAARWTPAELARMGEIQNRVVLDLLERFGDGAEGCD